MKTERMMALEGLNKLMEKHYEFVEWAGEVYPIRQFIDDYIKDIKEGTDFNYPVLMLYNKDETEVKFYDIRLGLPYDYVWKVIF